MLVALVEAGAGMDCTAAAERQRLARIKVMGRANQQVPGCGIVWNACANIDAQSHSCAELQDREAKDKSSRPDNGGADDPLYYEALTANIGFDLDAVEMPSYLGGAVLPV